jgi:2-polyprenyl-3-methyl-5-hydroxy-6-metoxy-1,4-benzoquinol methylase
MGQAMPFHYEPKEYGNIQSSVDYFLKFAIAKDKRVLDIGTNLGSFPHELQMRGYERVHGIDIREDAIEVGRQRYADMANRLSCYDGRTIPFDDGHFDVVTMFDVIEHIPTIDVFLFETNRILARGGRLIFQTPNIYINSVWSTIVWRSLCWKAEHCSLQSLRSLRKLLSRAGFCQIVIDKHSINTEFNRSEVSAQLGSIGILLLKLSDKLPLNLFPNFYGSAVK